MKKQYRLLNMHCAGCADALEQKLQTIQGVSHIKVNFVTKMLTFEVEKGDDLAVTDIVLNTVTKFDHMIKIEDPSTDVSEQEKRQKNRKLWFILGAVILTAAGLVFELTEVTFWGSLLCFVAAYLMVGYEVLWSSAVNISHGKIFDENFLMLIATIGAFAIGKYSEAVAVMLLYQIGELLQDLAVSKSKNAISALMDIKAKVATVVTEDGDITVEVSKVAVGSIIRVKAGERVPLDGIVTFGDSSLDTSAITGESAPLVVSIGDEVLSGSINGEGGLMIKVTADDSESTVSKIIGLVERATTNKAKTENFISKFARIYTPAVCAIALLLVFVPCLFLGFGAFKTFLYRGLVFLVVSCPCALVISIPLTFFAGLGAAARRGVLIKGSNYLEALNSVDTVIYDKTGTLTLGEFEIDEVLTYGDQSKDDIVEFVAYAESYSSHRIARSIVNKYCENHTINAAWIEDATEHAGLGVSAKIFMSDVLVGSKKLLQKSGINVHSCGQKSTAIYLAVGGEHVGTITLKDKIKPDAKQAISALKALGIKTTAMFTGDNEVVSASVASEIGVDKYFANMLPQDKVNKLAEIKAETRGIAFVGDGINDAPVLSTVDVGVAMGGVGSDIAVEASDIVLMTDEPSKMVDAIKCARKTHKIVTENVFLALGIKLAVLALSAFGFAGMWLAIFADVGVSVMAVVNSLRALR